MTIENELVAGQVISNKYSDRYTGTVSRLLVIRETRQRKVYVFYSFRINDVHDAFTPTEFAADVRMTIGD